MSKKPKEIADAICESGGAKAELPLDRMFVLAVLAGAYIAFGCHLATVVSQDSQPILGAGLTSLLMGSVFPVGLMLVVIGGAELFTGNSLMSLSCLTGKAKLTGLLRNWSVVYVGNLVGSLALVGLVFGGGLYGLSGGSLGLREVAIANAKVNIPFVEAFFRGILCNWLVCLAVWIATSSTDTIGKIFACFFPIMAFVTSSFEHSIANMFFIPIGIMAKGVPAVASKTTLDLANLTWEGFVTRNLVPVTLGNIVGGAFFVATLYWYAYLRK
jgi:formate/nitrite transporter